MEFLMLIDGKKYSVLDTKEKITIADSFVVRQNKSGSGNGEAKLYVGHESESLRLFYGALGFKIKCFVLKKDLIDFLISLKPEYENPKVNYINSENIYNLYASRYLEIQKLPEILYFEIDEQTQIEGTRIYVKSNSKAYMFIRELSLPEISYLSFIKLLSEKGEIIYYARLFSSFTESFGESVHPNIIEKENNQIFENATISTEQKRQTVIARVGQGVYRKNLLRECPACPVTGVSDDRLLIASHIKPWAASSLTEKTDPKNGFMLTPTIDHMFDQGFMTFDLNKRMTISPWISNVTLKNLGLKNGTIIQNLPIVGREIYLDYHQKNIFKA